jgi:hypothetical protein
MANQFNYSSEAIDLIENESVIRLKNELICQLEFQLQELGKQTTELYPKITKNSPHPKVSKGEKHQGLPFVVLDFPRNYSKKDIFAIRTLIWWSKHISISLVLKGEYLSANFHKVQEKMKEGSLKGLYLSSSGDIWNNELVNKIEKYTQLSENIDFIKLSFKFSLNQLNELESNYFSSIDKLLSFIDYARN